MASDGKRVVIDAKADLGSPTPSEMAEQFPSPNLQDRRKGAWEAMRRWLDNGGAMRPREVPAKELDAIQKAFRAVNAETDRLMRPPAMVGFDPASPGGDKSCLSIQSADLGEPDMVIVNGRRYVPAEGRDG